MRFTFPPYGKKIEAVIFIFNRISGPSSYTE
jgi:hypothetical protein